MNTYSLHANSNFIEVPEKNEKSQSGTKRKRKNLSKGTCPILHGKEGSSLFVLHCK
jgi:hypothetical protein